MFIRNFSQKVVSEGAVILDLKQFSVCYRMWPKDFWESDFTKNLSFLSSNKEPAKLYI